MVKIFIDILSELNACKTPLDVMYANKNHKLIIQILQIAAEYGGDAAEIISAFLASSIALQQSILHMLNNYYNDSSIIDFKDQVTETYNILAESYPEVVIGADAAARSGECDELIAGIDRPYDCCFNAR